MEELGDSRYLHLVNDCCILPAHLRWSTGTYDHGEFDFFRIKSHSFTVLTGFSILSLFLVCQRKHVGS